MSNNFLPSSLRLLTAIVLATSPAFAQVPEGLSSSDLSSIRGAYEDGRHRVFEVAGGFEARSHRQMYLSRFDGMGVSITPDDASWRFGLTLARYGRGESMVDVSSPLAASRDGRRVEYRWDERVAEWYVNGDAGLEHGFTVNAPPSGSGDLEFVLAVESELRGELDSDGHGVTFVDEHGRDALQYCGLVVVDAAGTALDAHITCTASELTLHVDDVCAVYPIVIDPVIQQQAYVKASNPGVGDFFGISVAIDGDTVVIGAQGERSNATGVNGDESNNSLGYAGAAYVFTRSGSSWSQQAYLKASNTSLSDYFGTSVDIDGDTIVVGAPGEDSSAVGVNGNQTDNWTSGAGAVYVFTRNGSTWTQQAYIKASNPGVLDRFGGRVAIDADTIVVGAEGENSSATGVDGDQSNNSTNDAGAVYVFTRSGSTWTQQAYVKASNTAASDHFGMSVAIDGDSLIVGAQFEDSSATGVNGDDTDNSASNSGAAYVFTRNGSSWDQQAYLKASNSGVGDQFGADVAICGESIVVGAPRESGGSTGVNGDQANDFAGASGAAYVFVRSGSVWVQQAYLKASNTDISDQFGERVAVDGDWVAVSTVWENSSATGVNGDQADDSLGAAGAAYLFSRSGSTWAQLAYLKASNTEWGDQFGASVAIHGGTVVVGALAEEGGAAGVNGNQADNSADGAGAVYIFDLDADWGIIPGCHQNSASFVVPNSAAQINTTVQIDLLGSVVSNGVVATYYGATGIDELGCGFLLAPNQELLLALSSFPTFHSFAVMTSGLATFTLTVPNNPSIVGFVVTLQSAAIDTTTFASEFSNGLEFVIRP